MRCREVDSAEDAWDAAEDIVNEVGRDLIAEFEQRDGRKKWFKKKRKKG
jgi:hypothetical protein